jgi:hypothetical protein
LVFYCVRQLVRYSDEVREFAAPEERDLLILTSRWYLTAGNWATNARSQFVQKPQEFTDSGMPVGCSERCLKHRFKAMKERSAAGLKYQSLLYWLNGTTRKRKNRGNEWQGVMRQWNVTVDGSVDGPIYKMTTNYGRHTRQTALSRDSSIPLITRQHDLNHNGLDEQFVYKHVLEEENRALLAKSMDVSVVGQKEDWLYDLLGIKADEQGLGESSQYKRGLVTLITPRFRRLLESNQEYIKDNLVPPGICGVAAGPDGCVDYRRAMGGGSRKDSLTHSRRTNKGEPPQKKRSSRPTKKQSRMVRQQSAKTDRSEALLGASSGIVSQLEEKQKMIKESGYGNTDEKR